MHEIGMASEGISWRSERERKLADVTEEVSSWAVDNEDSDKMVRRRCGILLWLNIVFGVVSC